MNVAFQKVDELTDLLLESLEGLDPSALAAKKDLAFYSEYLFKDEDGSPFQNKFFHSEIYEALTGPYGYVLILLPRGFAKSTCVSIVWPSWRIGQNPNLRFVIASDARDQSAQFLRAIEQVLQDEQYHDIFGNLVPLRKSQTWNDYEKIVVRDNPFIKEPSFLALGVHGAVLSRRADVLIGDDLVSRQNSGTPELRVKLSRWFWETFMPFRREGSKVIVIGTPLCPGDLYEELAFKWSKKEDAKILLIPALRKHGEKWISIWPERYPTQFLLDAQEADPIAFSSQYMLKAISIEAEGIDFDKDTVAWFTKLPDAKDSLDVYAALDPGGWGKRRRTNEFAVCVAYRLSGSRDLHLVYSRTGKGGLEAHANALKDMDALWKPRKIFVESNAAQMLLFEYLKKETRLPLEPIDSSSAKEARLAVLARHCNSGQVKLRGKTYRGKTIAHKEIKSFWEEFISFPSGQDNALDAAALLVENLLEKGPPPALSIIESAEALPSQLMRQRSARLFDGQRPGLFRNSRIDQTTAWYSKMQEAKKLMDALCEEGIFTNEDILDKLNKEFSLDMQQLQVCKILLGRKKA